MTIALPYFGEIKAQRPNESYDAEVRVDGRSVRLDLNCRASQPIDEQRLLAVGSILKDLDAWNRKNIATIRKDFEAGGEAAYYVDEFLDLLEEETIEKLLKDADNTTTRREQMLWALHLQRVGFYPDPQLYPKSDETFAVFDYTIGSDIVDHMVVVKYRFDGTLIWVEVES